MDKINDIHSAVLTELRRLTKHTADSVSVWDAFISLVKNKMPIYLLTLKADITVLEYIARGLSVTSIFQSTGISSKTIREAAFTWGLTPLDRTLDFNPLLVYNDGMSPEGLKYHMDEILPEPVSLDVCVTAINNIERYFDLCDILDKEDGE